MLQLVEMNPPVINSTNSVSTTRRKREAERSYNWTLEETQALLCAWSDERVQKSLAENLRNRHVFKHLSGRMGQLGFARSPHQCRLRVKTLKANYVRAKLQRSAGGQQTPSFKYFAEMDAVLGRKAAGGAGGALFTSSDGSIPQDFDSDLGGGHFGSLGRSRRQRAGTLETRGANESWRLDSEVKLEQRDESTDESEVVDSRLSQCPRDAPRTLYLESDVNPGITGSPEVITLPPPLPHLVQPPPPPPRIHPAPSPLAAPPEPSPAPSLELTLQRLLETFERLASETRGLLVQLENGRQEQARWHQDLLERWLQREERRHREAADREERREKARMAHEIRVLELLAGLSRGHGSGPGINQTGSSQMGPSLSTDKD